MSLIVWFLLFVQAEVEGQPITWLTPHSLQQVVSDDVDITTMLNFLQLYEVSFIFMLYLMFSFCQYVNIIVIPINRIIDLYILIM